MKDTKKNKGNRFMDVEKDLKQYSTNPKNIISNDFNTIETEPTPPLSEINMRKKESIDRIPIANTLRGRDSLSFIAGSRNNKTNIDSVFLLENRNLQNTFTDSYLNKSNVPAYPPKQQFNTQTTQKSKKPIKKITIRINGQTRKKEKTILYEDGTSEVIPLDQDESQKYQLIKKVPSVGYKPPLDQTPIDYKSFYKNKFGKDFSKIDPKRIVNMVIQLSPAEPPVLLFRSETINNKDQFNDLSFIVNQKHPLKPSNYHMIEMEMPVKKQSQKKVIINKKPPTSSKRNNSIGTKITPTIKKKLNRSYNKSKSPGPLPIKKTNKPSKKFNRIPMKKPTPVNTKG